MVSFFWAQWKFKVLTHEFQALLFLIWFKLFCVSHLELQKIQINVSQPMMIDMGANMMIPIVLFLIRLDFPHTKSTTEFKTIL